MIDIIEIELRHQMYKNLFMSMDTIQEYQRLQYINRNYSCYLYHLYVDNVVYYNTSSIILKHIITNRTIIYIALHLLIIYILIQF